MNFFKRLFKIGEAEANAAVDNIEDPIHMTEQGIRDLKQDLSKSLEALAQVKALAIRSKNETQDAIDQAEAYQEKAMLILKKAQSGALDPDEADQLAKKALVKKEEATQQVKLNSIQTEKFEDSVAKLEKNVQEIKKNVSTWENELKTLKARVKVAKATKNLNKQMAEIDSSSTVDMLKRMQDKLQQEEALAEAYGDISKENTSIDQEIDSAVGAADATVEADLAKLKEQLKNNND